MGHDHNKKSIHEYYRMIIYFLNESKHYLCIGDILTRPALKLDCSNSKKDKNKTKQKVIQTTTTIFTNDCQHLQQVKELSAELGIINALSLKVMW